MKDLLTYADVWLLNKWQNKGLSCMHKQEWSSKKIPAPIRINETFAQEKKITYLKSFVEKNLKADQIVKKFEVIGSWPMRQDQ